MNIKYYHKILKGKKKEIQIEHQYIIKGDLSRNEYL